MPSPVGHSLIGLAVGACFVWPSGRLTARFPDTLYRLRMPVFWTLFFANAPDLDYVPGLLIGDLNAFHHLHTHTLGWIGLVATGAWCCWKAWQPDIAWREWWFMFAVLASHLLADTFTDDGAYPYGILLWWPFSNERVWIWPLFPRPTKATVGDLISWHNLRVMGIEFLMTFPLLLVVLGLKRCGLFPVKHSGMIPRHGNDH